MIIIFDNLEEYEILNLLRFGVIINILISDVIVGNFFGVLIVSIKYN